MAKKFGGFTPEQQQTLLSRVGYTGPAQQDDINKFMMSSPKAASMLGKYAEMAKARVSGGPTVGMADGGITKRSTGEADFYQYGGRNYNTMAEAQAAQAQATTAPATAPTAAPTAAPAATPAATSTTAPTTPYDPAAGLPALPSTDTSANYDLVKQGSYWVMQYPDGTVIPTGHRNQSLAQSTADTLVKTAADEAQASGEGVRYDTELGQYDAYYRQQAGEALTDTRGTLDTAQANLSQEENLLNTYTQQLAGMAADDPQRQTMQTLIDQQQVKVTNAKAGLSQAQTNVERVGMPSTTEMRAATLEDPTSMVTTADVATVTDAQRAAGKMASGTGQAGPAATAASVQAAIAGDVVAPEVKAAAIYTAEQAAQQVQDTLDKLTAITGKPSDEALADAQTMSSDQLAQLGLTVEQIQQAVTVQAPDARVVQEGELVEGSVVDMGRVEQAINFEAATGVPSTEATVQGQLTQLLQQFEGGETPAWAAGAMRAATATLAARGLGASSMAGQAIVQAAMESALPIAQQDAQTRASFEAQNLSNRQQTAMFAAQERARFLGIEFDQEFQARVTNAARIADIANINFSAEQQIALENARMAQTVDIANLNAKNAKVMADAAAMTQLDLTNLNNRQQAAVQNAQSFLQMDMANLSNQQQVAIFKAQGNIQSIITDAAAMNAAAQFNAASENQTNQFYDNLTTQVAQFNNEQKNAMERFNADQANAVAQFNAAQKNARDQFNANNALVVAQANAQWEQAIATAETAAQNAANRDAAIAANNLTETTYNNMLQQERDAMDYAWRSAESSLDREHNLVMAEMQSSAAVSSAKGAAAGKVAAVAADFLLKKIF